MNRRDFLSRFGLAAGATMVPSVREPQIDPAVAAAVCELMDASFERFCRHQTSESARLMNVLEIEKEFQS